MTPQPSFAGAAGVVAPDRSSRLLAAKRPRTLWFVGLGLAALVARDAHAQRRGESTAPEVVLEVTLPKAVRFGEVVVAAGRYRLNVGPAGVAFVNPTTMVAVTTVNAPGAALTSRPAGPSVELIEKETGAVEVVVRGRDKLYVASGTKSEGGTTEPKVELAARPDVELGKVVPDQLPELQLVEQTIAKRYYKDVKHCGDGAQKNHWKTDDPRFVNCVCPLVRRWRLPKVSAETRIHYPLVKGHAGMTLWLTIEGKVKDCHVWIGAEPPPDNEGTASSQTPPGTTAPATAAPANNAATPAASPPAKAEPATEKKP